MDEKNVNTLFNKVHEKYGLNENQKFNYGGFNKKRELVALQLLMEEAERCGATSDEMMDILEYIAVVIDAEKHLLDWERAYVECKIDHYINKYVEGVENEDNN